MNEKTVSSQQAFDGRLLKLDVLEVELDDGRRARREVVRHPGAAAIWARAPDGRFVFVRQFRKAIEQELLEIVAGKLEDGETPEACARREIREETGYAVKTMAPLGCIFTAPGFCTEQIFIFYAELSGGGAAAPDPDERLDVVLLDEGVWKDMMARGAVQDAKTLAAWGMFLNAKLRMQNEDRKERSKVSGQRTVDNGSNEEQRTDID